MTLLKDLGICLVFSLLRVSSIFGEERLVLDLNEYNSTMLDMSCRFEGEQTNLTFVIFKDRRKCLNIHDSTCKLLPQHESYCQVYCQEMRDPKIVSFLVKLNGSCEVKHPIKCSVSASMLLHLQPAIFELTATSDAPIIYVNNGQPIEAGSNVSIVCKITNQCSLTQIEISSDFQNMTEMEIFHQKQGTRFSTTAKTIVTFASAGNYTIICIEVGKDNHFSKRIPIEVHEKGDPPVISVNDNQPVEAGCKPVEITCTITNVCRKAKLEIRSEVPMQIVNITHIEHGVRFNTTTKMKAIFNETGNYTIVCKEIGKDDVSSRNYTLLVEPKIEKHGHTENIFWIYIVISIPIILIVTSTCLARKKIKSSIKYLTRALTPRNRRNKGNTGHNRNEDEEALLWSEGKRAKIQMHPVDRLLWEITLHLHKERILYSHISKTLIDLIRSGANPFTPFGVHNVFSLFLEESTVNQEESVTALVSEFIEEASKERSFFGNKNILNAIIKSTPQRILAEQSSHISVIKEIIVKNCLSMIEEDPALRDHEDSEGKTPLHDLMEKLFLEDAWQIMPKMVEGTDSLWNLISELITKKNMNIKDKNNVTPYSWISWVKEAVTLQDGLVSQNLLRKIDDISVLMKDANTSDAHQGLTYIR